MADCWTPAFFKILLKPSAPHLPLPHAFMSKYLKNKIPDNPTLESATGGYLWKVKIEKIGESYYFTHGWNNVVRDARLGFGYFLVFKLVHESTFRVSIFSPSGCEEFLPFSITKIEDDDDDDDSDVHDDDDVVYEGSSHEEEEERDDDDDDGDVVCEGSSHEEEEERDDDDEDENEDYDDDDDDYYDDDDEESDNDEEEEEERDDDDEDEDDDDDEEDENEDDDDDDEDDGDGNDPFFRMTISKSHKHFLWLPSEFVELAGIGDQEVITAKNVDGQEWELGLRSEKYGQVGKYRLLAGWCKFRRSNELSKGDECLFKYIKNEGKLCIAKVSRKNPPAKTPATEVVERKRGRPSATNSLRRKSQIINI